MVQTCPGIKPRSPILDQTEKSKCSLVFTKSDVGNFFRVIDISGLGRSSNWRTFGWLLIRGGRPELLKRKVNMSCVVWWLMVEASLMWLLSFLPQESQSTARKLGGGHPSRHIYIFFKFSTSQKHRRCDRISAMSWCNPIDTVPRCGLESCLNYWTQKLGHLWLILFLYQVQTLFDPAVEKICIYV